MPLPRRQPPYPLLLEPGYWRHRLAQMEKVHRGLLLLPRPDLSNRSIEIVEWRLRAHDGVRLSGLRASSPLHCQPKGVWIRRTTEADLDGIYLEGVALGCVEYILRTMPERRLEDRVLDLVRVCQVAVNQSGLPAQQIVLVPHVPGEEPDEDMIATRLLQKGLV